MSWTISIWKRGSVRQCDLSARRRPFMFNLKTLATVALLSSFAFAANATDTTIDISDLQASINAEFEQSMSDMQKDIDVDVKSTLVADKEDKTTVTTAEVRIAE